MILVVVDRFAKMANNISIPKKNSHIVAWPYLENISTYHRVLEDVVSDCDVTVIGQYLCDLYDQFRIEKSTSTAFHLQTDG